jgi:ABC-type sugar transport system substrate-binding protein
MKANMKKLIATLLVMSCLLTIACSKNDSPPADTEETVYKIGVCSPNNGVPFFSRLIAGLQDKAAEFGGKYVLDIVDANDDTNTQINQVETFIAAGVDFIIMMPTQVEALIPVAKECNEAGIPFITINRTLTTGDIADTGVDMITYVGADDYTGGLKIGELVEQMTGGKGNILFMQATLGASFSELRQAGCTDYLTENCPDVKILDFQCSNQDLNTAMSITDNWLAKYGPGEIDGIVVISSYDGIGVADAIEAAGRDDMTGKIVGFDYPPENLEYIKAGKMYGTVIQAPYDQGYIGLGVVDQYFTEGRGNIAENTWTELPVVTVNTIDQYPEAAW